MVMNFSRASSLTRPEGQATYSMSNLPPEETGLDFVVFISQKDDARHAARVKVSNAPKTIVADMASYAIRPFAHKVGPRLSSKDEQKLAQWIELNEQTLLDYWNGTIMYTSQVLKALKTI